MDLAVLDGAAQHLYQAALGDLSLQTVQKLRAFRAFLPYTQIIQRVGLCHGQEFQQLAPINRMFTIVVPWVSLLVTYIIHQRGDDDRFQTLFTGVCLVSCAPLRLMWVNPALLRQHIDSKTNLARGELQLALIPGMNTANHFFHSVGLFMLHHPVHSG